MNLILCSLQAAIGSIPLDTARKRGHQGSLEEELGIKIVTIAVLAILVTAPIGAVMITLTGPRFLKKKCDAADEIEMKEDVVNKCQGKPSDLYSLLTFVLVNIIFYNKII